MRAKVARPPSETSVLVSRDIFDKLLRSHLEILGGESATGELGPQGPLSHGGPHVIKQTLR